DGEREIVEPRTELGDLVGRIESGALAEEPNGFRGGERRYRVLDLALHAQELPARNDQREVGTGRYKCGELGRCLDHLLQVVEEKEHLPLADVLGESVARSERLGDRLRDEGRLA